MGDRGAELTWLSQYPHEAEVCFPPVLGLEVQTHADGSPAKRTEGSVVIVELRPSVASGLGAPFAAPGPLERLTSCCWPFGNIDAHGDRVAETRPHKGRRPGLDELLTDTKSELVLTPAPVVGSTSSGSRGLPGTDTDVVQTL
jgi:hypothetical protein